MAEARILQVCSARRAVYGAVRSALTLAAAQRADGDRVEFAAFRGRPFAGQVRELGYAVHEVPVRLKVDPVAVARLRRLIRNGGYDVVHTHLSTSSVLGCLSARLARVPCVASVHGMSHRLSFLFADRLIAVSGGVRDHLRRQGVPAERIDVVHNGVALPPPQDRAAARDRVGLPRDGFIAGTVSRVTTAKGIDHALAAVARMDAGVRYVVLGDGDGLAAAQARARALGVAERVEFRGFREDVADHLAAFDAFLFPSLREAMGIALVEAMAAGLPVVATHVDGIPEVVGEAGVLVPPADAAALADALTHLRDCPQEARTLALAARERAGERFGIDAMRTATAQVYARAGARTRAAGVPLAPPPSPPLASIGERRGG